MNELPLTITSLSGSVPHPDWGSWHGFLESCELRDVADGVRFYGKTNCNYILFPDGSLVENYGFNGKALMTSVRTAGREPTLSRIKELATQLAQPLDKGRCSDCGAVCYAHDPERIGMDHAAGCPKHPASVLRS